MNKTEWKELTPKQQWDILVAMRGPDCHNSEPIKWLTTAVLRSSMSEVMRVGGTINEDLKMVVVPANWSAHSLLKLVEPINPSTKEALEKIAPPHGFFYPGHFFQHILEAASILGLPSLMVGTTLWQDAFKEGNHYINLLGKLVEGLKKANIDNKYPAYPKELVSMLEAHFNHIKGRY